MFPKNPQTDAELAAHLQRFWPHRAHESGALRALCCFLGFHLWAQPDYSALVSRRSIRFCCWCSTVEIDGVDYS
ncbi:MAG: hypothetical protein WCC26_07900 [Terracidiphilus sp.]